MDSDAVFSLALGLEGTPWRVMDVRFDTELRRLEIDLDLPPGSRFPQPESGQDCPVYDTEMRSWRHLNFFQFECYLHAHVPRVDGGPGAGVKRVAVPWVWAHSGFSLLMESMRLVLTRSGMTVAKAARTLGGYPQRLWLVILHHIAKADRAMNLESVQVISVDELCQRRGYNYLTIESQPKSGTQPRRVLLVIKGRESRSLKVFRDHFKRMGLSAAQIRTICSDMSPAYIKGISEQFGHAVLVFDYFHVVQLATRALDEVGRRERREFPQELQGARWALLQPQNQLQTGKAFNHVDALRTIMAQTDVQAAEADLKWWCGWVSRSRIPEMKKVACTLRDHWDGVVAYLKTRVTNGAAAALNGTIQNAKRKDRGFKSVEYFTASIYLIGSHLELDIRNPLPATHTKSY